MITEMHTLINPRKTIAAETDIRKMALSLKESNAFCFAFKWVGIRAESQVVGNTMIFDNFKHLLKTDNGRSKDPIIIAISRHSVEIIVDPAS